MIRLTLITLISIYLVLVTLGRDEAQLTQSQPAPEPAQASQLAAQPAATPGENAATITPVRLARMPGPALRPSPEYRARPEPAASNTVWVVNTKSLNVRSGPSTANGVVERLTQGEEVRVVADPGNGWVQIRIEGDGVNGWVSKRLLRLAR